MTEHALCEVGVFYQFFCRFENYLAGLLDVDLVAQWNVENDTRPSLRVIANANDFTVAHIPEHAVDVTNLGDSQTNVFDYASCLAQINAVSDSELIFEDYEETIDEVFHQTLRTEAKCGSQNSGAGHKGTDRNSQFAKHRANREQQQ